MFCESFFFNKEFYKDIGRVINTCNYYTTTKLRQESISLYIEMSENVVGRRSFVLKCNPRTSFGIPLKFDD
jgi:hypothetical protein